MHGTTSPARSAGAGALLQLRGTTRSVATAAFAAALIAVSPAAPRESAGGMVEWPCVGADQAASKYSPLADVDASNVDRLRIAWTWEPNGWLEGNPISC